MKEKEIEEQVDEVESDIRCELDEVTLYILARRPTSDPKKIRVQSTTPSPGVRSACPAPFRPPRSHSPSTPDPIQSYSLFGCFGIYSAPSSSSPMLITPRVPYLSSSDHSAVFASDPIDRWHRVDRINLGIIRAIRRKEVARSLGEIPVFDWPEITDRQHRELSSHPITSRHDEYPEVAHANDGPVPVIAGKRERERRSTKISLDLRRCCTVSKWFEQCNR